VFCNFIKSFPALFFETMKLFLKLCGRVQGVFLRSMIREKTQELNLNGWVKNCYDGTVELEAEGERKDLEKLILWLRRNPGYSRIDKIDIDWQVEEKGYKGFEIVY